MSSARSFGILTIVLAILLLVVPGAWDSTFSGSPLTPAGRAVLVALFALTWLCVVLSPARRLPLIVPCGIAGLVAIKLLLALSSVPSGFQGTYRVDGDASPISFFARFRQEPFRIDRRLAFEGPVFGLHFLNDLQKYGARFTSTRRDVEYPLHVSWTGHVPLREPMGIKIDARARGGLYVEVDGRTVLDRSEASTSTTVTTDILPAGLRRIVVRYEKPANAPPEVRVGLFNLRGEELAVVPWQVPMDAIGRQDLLARATTLCVLVGSILTVLGLVWMYAPLLQTMRGRTSTLAAPLATFLLLTLLASHVLVSARPYIEQTVDLTAGNDWLAYEGNAREIVHDGLLMSAGAAPGQGKPYYFYPLYPYALAAGHALIGEDYGAVVLVNGLAVASLVPLCWLLAWRDLPGPAAVAGVAALGLFAWRHLLHYVQAALSDSIFVAIAFAALLACRQALERGGVRRWLLAGIAIAAGAATRPNFLTFLPLFAVSLLAFRRGGGTVRSRGARVALLAAGFALGVLPFMLRNAMVSGKVVMLVNSWIQIPYFLVPPEIPPVIPSEGVQTFGGSLRVAAAMLANDPLTILWVECRKVLFTLGATFPPIGIQGAHSAHWDLVVLSILFLAALILRRLHGTVALVLGTFAVSHVAAMVMAAPWTYGYKTILPLHAAFLVGAVYLLVPRCVSATADAGSAAVLADVPGGVRV